MDAKSKANFINSIAGGQNIPCPKCNNLNEADAKFCTSCGTKLVRKIEEDNVPVTPLKKVEKVKQFEDNKELVNQTAPVQEYKEPESIFAEGLPSWNIEPPQVMVRRKRK